MIGEAARHIDEKTIPRLPGVPWREVRNARNVLVQESFGLSPRIIWETMVCDLPPVAVAMVAELEG